MKARSDVGSGAPPAVTRPGPSGPDPLGFQLSLVARRARARFEQRLHEAGGGFATWRVLEALGRRGPMIQGDLAASLCITGPTATRTLDRMIAEGLVRRRPVPTDRRKVEVVLTPEGQRLRGRLADVIGGADAELSEGLSAAELRTLRRLLDRMLHNVAM